MARRKAILALLLFAPAPSIGAAYAMLFFPHSALGSGVFAASKLWLFAFPLAWRMLVEKRPVSFSPVRNGGLGMGLLSGGAVSLAILALYLAFGDETIDSGFMAGKLAAIGLGTPARYAAGAAYWILVNSVLEEYAWRWFCVRQCEALAPQRAAAVLAAMLFTVHHAVALSVYLGAAAAALCSAGVFSGALIWSMMYLRYRSIWPGYISHAIVDLCVFSIGAAILFW